MLIGLNKFWAKGPDLLNNLLGVLIRFRENRIVISGNIRKMYHAVKIDSIGQHTHRFLWRNMEIEREPDVYVITSLSFRDKPAGNIASLALRKTAEMGKETYSKPANVIQNITYVDDIIDSVDSLNEAKELTEDIDKLLQPGGFEIKHWTIHNESESSRSILESDSSLSTGTSESSCNDIKGGKQNNFQEIKIKGLLIKRCWVLDGILKQIYFISVCELTFHQEEIK